MNKKNILISTSTFAVYDKTPLLLLKKEGINYTINPYKRKLNKNESKELLKGKTGLVAGTEILDKEILGETDSLKVISRVGVGLDNIDLSVTKQMGIAVYNTPDVLTDSVAELTVGILLDCLRGISFVDREMRSGLWNKYMGKLLKGKTVGLIGLGRIGKKVADILSDGFECTIIYCDPYTKCAKFGKVSLSHLIKHSDIISMHANTKEIILTKENINKLKNDVIVINTSRAKLIDEHAMCEALKKNKIAYAGFDVFWKEPYKGILGELNNVVLTPHIGSYAKESRVEMEIQSINNLIKGYNEVKL